MVVRDWPWSLRFGIALLLFGVAYLLLPGILP